MILGKLNKYREQFTSLSQFKDMAKMWLGSTYKESSSSPDKVKATQLALGQPVKRTLKNKVVFISGASRGIGLAIAKCVAQEGAKVVLTGKTTQAHAKLPGTIYTAVEEIESLGGNGMAIKMDLRNDDEIKNALKRAANNFGGIDILINSASAIYLRPATMLTMKQFDLMNQINLRGTYAICKFAYPYLKKSKNPHIISLSPPLNLDEKWFNSHFSYTMAKYGMSMTVKGFASEWKKDGIGVNALWPKTIIATAAIKNLPMGKFLERKARKPEIMAKAARQIMLSSAKRCTGNFFIDEDVLKARGEKSMKDYSVVPGATLQKDLFL